MSNAMSRILVIKLGALGDFVQAFPPFQAIRTTHRNDQITLLTTAPFLGLAQTSPWFDSVLYDERPDWTDINGLLRLRTMLQGFDRIYDLQTSSRSSRYRHLAGRTAEWCGIAPNSSLRHDNPARNAMHTRARQRDQLRRAGIHAVPDADLAWLTPHGPELPTPYILLAPGAAAHRPAKRWPVARFASLATQIAQRGFTPVIIGSRQDSDLAETIRQTCPTAQNLTGQTDLPSLAGLMSRAAAAIGNDTGPMHLAAATGCRSIVLFSADSNPALTAPIGRTAGQVSIISLPDLATLQVERVAALLPERH